MGIMEIDCLLMSPVLFAVNNQIFFLLELMSNNYLSTETAASVKLLAYMVRLMKKWTTLHMKEPNTQPSRE